MRKLAPLPFVVSVALGLFFGMTLRLGPAINGLEFLQVMSFGFLFFGPLAIGAITAYSFRNEEVTWTHAFFAPWLSITLGCLVAAVLRIEGFICIAMYLPAALLLGSIGGISLRYVSGRPKKYVLASFLILPFASQLLESQIPPSERFQEVKTEIVIHAPPAAVWNEIKSVRAISREELPGSWEHRMGFPRPLDAVINHEGLGGVRLARFERGLVFDETVTEWEPLKKLGFDIRADEVPAMALDEHVTIGGPYFDVLHGVYEIEPVDNGVVLKLKSRFRISTHFNAYSALWTEMIMNRIQGDILQVVRNRAEKPI